ncbi:hypothetical protein Lalb_Chr11g0069841 [Lupinus albus]|uniref:Uncharacterized protein n=1 Tax=Lupinus albus TaxID=3870 RepID=A0A6A4PRK5_LUPAL|nr:hypothetical protein Lalb_Chr11g0069841 [Lupinus albus]
MGFVIETKARSSFLMKPLILTLAGLNGVEMRTWRSGRCLSKLGPSLSSVTIYS